MLKWLLSFACLTGLITSSCTRTSDQLWDDTVSCSRYMGRGLQSLCGGAEDSRQVRAPDDFWCCDEELLNYNPHFSHLWDEYESQEVVMSDLENPAKTGSLPSIQAFMDPGKDPLLSRIFCKLHFDYNSNLIKNKEDIQAVQAMADYLKKHPDTYIYVEGHCDKRGPEAYNLALGSRRSNEVKSWLVKQGVNPDHILTISYGKERLLASGNDESSHRQNRRAEFKIYER